MQTEFSAKRVVNNMSMYQYQCHQLVFLTAEDMSSTTNLLAKEKDKRNTTVASSVLLEIHSTHFASSAVEVAAASSPLMEVVAEVPSCRWLPVHLPLTSSLLEI
jgi:hypothetical protein